ncbi:MAG: Phosphatidylglycerol/phosphatidylinositol transfer protein [Chaenotheca gracillima]|nr:MAG: Phosphatidylglycerol/phosphatidylinositol transfer protein [Chaenotheca gracillima]
MSGQMDNPNRSRSSRRSQVWATPRELSPYEEELAIFNGETDDLTQFCSQRTPEEYQAASVEAARGGDGTCASSSGEAVRGAVTGAEDDNTSVVEVAVSREESHDLNSSEDEEIRVDDIKYDDDVRSELTRFKYPPSTLRPPYLPPSSPIISSSLTPVLLPREQSSQGSPTRLVFVDTIAMASSNTGAESQQPTFTTFDHGHVDAVRTVSYNLYGDRLATGSADHRIKVFQKENGAWKLEDTWTAHDAELLEVKWISPQIGSGLGSIGDDGRFKMWEEDVYAQRNSGRRFKCVASLRSQTDRAYTSFDFKHIRNQETFLALLTRDAHLSVWEATDYDMLHEWRLVESHFVCTPPSLAVEPSFKVHTEPAELPCWTGLMAGLNEKAFGMVTAGMETVKVWRLNAERRLYAAAIFPPHPGLVRDAAWANGSAWPYDLIATACRDGWVRVFKMTTPEQSTDLTTATLAQKFSDENGTSEPSSSDITSASQQNLSGIGAGLAIASQPQDSRSSARDSISVASISDIPPIHHVEEIAKFGKEYGTPWEVKWFNMGKGLISTHENGSIHAWLCDIDGNWTEHSAIESAP